MYVPRDFEEPDLAALHALMRSQPLATVVTLSSEGLNANHVPLHLTEEPPFGILRGHVARSNTIWKGSQNQPARNQAGVVQGLREQGGQAAAAMAGLVAGKTKSSLKTGSDDDR
jgi:predicted FMN-binding regulatory protein PaiB